MNATPSNAQNIPADVDEVNWQFEQLEERHRGLERSAHPEDEPFLFDYFWEIAISISAGLLADRFTGSAPVALVCAFAAFAVMYQRRVRSRMRSRELMASCRREIVLLIHAVRARGWRLGYDDFIIASDQKTPLANEDLMMRVTTWPELEIARSEAAKRYLNQKGIPLP